MHMSWLLCFFSGHWLRDVNGVTYRKRDTKMEIKARRNAVWSSSNFNKWNMLRANASAIVVMQFASSADAINWGPKNDVPHSARVCIHPPPFGQQCTVHSGNALAACASNTQCHALTCPSPEPYRARRRDGIHGPICQLRVTPLPAWLAGSMRAVKHGMCKPSRCANIFLTRVRLRAGARHALFKGSPSLQGSDGARAVDSGHSRGGDGQLLLLFPHQEAGGASRDLIGGLTHLGSLSASSVDYGWHGRLAHDVAKGPYAAYSIVNVRQW